MSAEKEEKQGAFSIRAADMSEAMQNDAIDTAREAFKQCKVEKEIAEHIKKTFDQKYHPNWHCVVGKSFGSFCTHESGYFIYFYHNNVAVLLFKSG
mmetsp:Transcript_3753/g.10359  ORF Transcript_3753/g.10359 Transcript_3753/m.10359 type:complete len:96 (-) Transcript_3753:62-349(-)